MSDILNQAITIIKHPGQFARNVFITFSTQILVLILGLIYTALIGRGLGTEGKGILDVAIIIPAILGILLGGGISVANVYFAGTKKLSTQTLTDHSISFMLCTVVLSVIGIFLLSVTGLLDFILPNIPQWIIILILISLPFELLYASWRGILQGNNQILEANVVNFVKIISLVLLTAAALYWFSNRLLGAVLAWLFASVISLIPLTNLLHKQGASFVPKWNHKTMKQMLNFGLRGYMGNLLQFFNYRLDLLIVNFFVGAAAVGIYSVSTRMAETLWFLPSAVGFVIMPKAASTSAKKMNKFTPTVFWITLLITFLGALGLVVLGGLFIDLVFGADFIDAYKPLLILLPGVVLLGGGKVLTNEITGRGYPQYNAVAAAVGLGVTIVLDIILIPKWGILGAALASSIAYTTVFFVAVIFYLVIRRQPKSREEEVRNN